LQSEEQHEEAILMTNLDNSEAIRNKKDIHETTAKAAIEYAAKRGWHVFPARVENKSSFKAAKFSGGKKWGATNRPDEVHRDFIGRNGAGIGIPTGSINELWVLDADTAEGHGVDGIASIKDLEDEHGPLPETLMAQSPSGSVHWYWKLPNSGTVIKNSASQVAPGVDVRGEGGMVLAPPTVKPGKGAYRWLNDAPIADAPEWLIKLATVKKARNGYTPEADDAQQDSEPEADFERIAAAIAVLPNDDLDWESWNNTGLAIYRATGGSEEGFRLFDAWSNKSKKGDSARTQDKWEKYHTCPPNSIGAGSIFHWADEACPDYELLANTPGHEVHQTVVDFIEQITAVESTPAPRPKLEHVPATSLADIIARAKAQKAGQQDGTVAPVAVREESEPQASSALKQQDTPTKPSLIVPQPYVCKDPKTLPRRDWLYDYYLIRGSVSMDIAPGGTGKTNQSLVEACAMASGKALLGVQPKQRYKVWYWNLEDPADEIDRRIEAIRIHYNLKPEDLDGYLYINHGRETPLVLAVAGKNCVHIVKPVVDNLVAAIEQESIDVIMVDPWVSSHRVPENDNVAADMVLKEWGNVAGRGKCAVRLSHHTRKGDVEITSESGRGASSVRDAARVFRVFNRMSKEEAEQAGIEGEGLRRRYYRTYPDKQNMAPPAETSDWYYLESISLGNSPASNNPFDQGDSVGVATRWQWPETTAPEVTKEGLDACREAIRPGRWRYDAKASDWVGHPIALRLGFDLRKGIDKKRVKTIIDHWITEGVLRVVDGKDAFRKTKQYVEAP
jgi:hypothetical protein